MHASQGTVEAICIRPKRRAAVEQLNAVDAIRDTGLVGDHYANRGGGRQVTLIQAEHLQVVAALLKVFSIKPELSRRNIVVSGINLLSLKGSKFQIGEAVFEYSGECHPCSRMEENFGTGGYNAMRGHGGITARVVESGAIRTGDRVILLHADTSQ